MLNKLITFFCLIVIIPGHSLAATTATTTVTANILQGESSISVDTALLDFGAISGSSTNRRFVVGPIKVTFFAAGSPWTIRVYTNNPNDAAGLIGVTNPNENIPLKAWDDNYGPRNHRIGLAPDEENTYFWRGYDFNGNGSKEDVITSGSISEVALGFDVNGDGDAIDTGLGTQQEPVTEDPVWLRVPNYNEMDPRNPFTWRRLLTQEWTRGEGPGPGPVDPNSFPVFFAIDVTGISPQAYKTGTLTFQIINE